MGINIGQRWNRVDLNKLGVGIVAGLIAGTVVGGIGARLAMRGIALAAGLDPGFTIGGTMAIFFVGAFIGMLFGLPFVWLWRRLPLPGRAQGLLYGLVLCLLFVVPPFLFSDLTGELALASPLLGFSFFAPIPILYGLVLNWLTGRIENRFTVTRQITLGWFVTLLMALLLFFVNIGTLSSPTLPLPPLVSKAYRAAGLSFSDARTAHTLFTALFTLVYCLFLAAIFWRNHQRPLGRWAVLVLLLFGAAFFQSGSGRAIPMLTIAILPKLLQLVGLSGLLILLVTWPDGYFKPAWMRPLVMGWIGLLALDLLLIGANSWPAGVRVGIMAITLGLGCLGQWSRYRQSNRPGLFLGLLLTTLTLLTVWLTILQVEGLMAGRPLGLSFMFNFTPFLLPWLLLPITILKANAD